MKVGLFFGSFNPIHIGHMIIANFMASQTDLDKVWFVISPQSPFKKKSSLLNDYDRLHLVQLAIEYNSNLKASNIEFSLPQPSYTVDTLTHLKEKNPEIEFVLIMGGDNLPTFPKWKNHEIILKNHEIYVYQRPGYELGPLTDLEQVKVFEAPQMHISASYIRKCIADGHSIQYLVPESVFDYINSGNLYKR